MTTVTKELNLLDIEDIEEAFNELVGRNITISELCCTIIYHLDNKQGFTGMSILFDYGDEWDLFDASELFERVNNELFWKGKRLAINEPCLPVKNYFNFDISTFKYFETQIRFETKVKRGNRDED